MLKQLVLKFILLLIPEFVSHEKKSAYFLNSVHLLFLFTAFRPANITVTRVFRILLLLLRLLLMRLNPHPETGIM